MLLGEEWRDNAWGSSREWLLYLLRIVFSRSFSFLEIDRVFTELLCATV